MEVLNDARVMINKECEEVRANQILCWTNDRKNKTKQKQLTMPKQTLRGVRDSK